MIWLELLLVVLLLLAVATVVCLLLVVLRYQATEEKRWKDRVLALFQRAQQQVREESRILLRLKSELEHAERVRREGAFLAYLGEIAVQALAEYPGIGPATIDKLRESGYQHLAGLVHARIQVQGLGPKRLADIDHAVRELLRKARSTFDSGLCRQAAAWSREREQVITRYQALEARIQARVAAVREVNDRLWDRARVARRITLWRWLRSGEAPLVPPAMRTEGLPDLDAALREAEARINEGHLSPQRQAAPPSEPLDVVPAAQPASTLAAAAPSLAPAFIDNSHLLFLELVIQFAFGVARRDGRVSAAERQVIQEHVRQQFSSTRALLNRAEAFCAHYEKSRLDLPACLAEINRQFTAADRADLLALAGRIVAVSKRQGTDADAFVARLARQLGLNDMSPPQVATPAPAPTVTTAAEPTRSDCLALLEIAPTAPLSVDLVRRQWTSLSQRYAPEKLAVMGPEFVKMAESKRDTIRHAAERLLKELGEESLEPASPPPPAELRENKLLDDFMGGT